MIFSMIFGLSINIQKSTVLSIGRDTNLAFEIPRDIQCRSESLSMNYLGLSIGSRVLDCKS